MIPFALMGVVSLGAVGLSVDYGRYVSASSRLQAITDAAALEGALVLKATGGDSAKSKTAAETYVNALLVENGQTTVTPGSFTSNGKDALKVTVNASTGDVQVDAAIDVQANIMGAYYSWLTLSPQTKYLTAATSSHASVAVKGLDLGLMVDVTGSMGWSDNTISQSDCSEADGTKLGAARCASKDLFAILYPATSFNSSGDSTSIRTAIVPFSQQVDVSLDTAKAVTGQNATRSCRNYKVRKRYNNSYSYSCASNTNWQNSSSCYNTTAYCEDTPSGSSGTDYVTSGNAYNQYLTSCMIERANRNTTDNVPATGDFTPSWSNSSNSTCTPNAEVLPLTGSKSALTTKINSLTTPSGGTAGHLGTAWAWFAISPNFASVWPTSSQPAAYDDPKTIKAVILLTDGDYTMHNTVSGCNGSNNCTPARQDARAACTAMKAKGVMVFAVGFGLAGSNTQLTPAQIAALPEDDGRKVLADCAGEGRYFFPYNGTALRAAFSDIGKALTAVLGNVRLADQAN